MKGKEKRKATMNNEQTTNKKNAHGQDKHSADDERPKTQAKKTCSAQSRKHKKCSSQLQSVLRV